MALRTVGVKLTAEIGSYVSNMRRAQESTKSFADGLKDKAASGHLDAVADRAGVMGIALGGAFAGAVKVAADFDKQMSAVKAAANDSTKSVAENAKNMKDLRAAALQAGKDTQYSAVEAAKGITELSKAGVKTADVLNGGLKGALSLAAAGQLDVAEAAEIAASAMTQFKLGGDQIPHVADLLSAGANKAQGSVHDMGMALNQTGLVAAQTGLSIEETTGMLAMFASAGLTGADAGTSMKQMLLMMQAPSAKTKALIEDLGISLYDSQGKFIGAEKWAGRLTEAFKDMTPEARQAAMAQIFGADAVRAGAIVYENGAIGVKKWQTEVNDAGNATRTAAELTNNLAGDVERLKGSLETMAIEAGSGANGALRILVKTLGAIVDQLGSMNSITGIFLVAAGGLLSAVLLGTAAWVKYRRSVAETREQLTQMGPAGAKAATAVGRLTSLAGGIVGWGIALEAGATALNNIAAQKVNVDDLTSSLKNLMDTGKMSGEAEQIFGKDWDKLGEIAGFADGATRGIGKFVNETLGGLPIVGDFGSAVGNLFNRLAFGTDVDTATAQMADLDKSLTDYMTTTKDATKASELWNRILNESGLDTKALADLLPNAYKQLGVLNTESMKTRDGVGTLAQATTAAKTATEEYKTVTEAAAAALRGERSAYTALTTTLKAETDPVFGVINAQQKVVESANASAEAIKKHGRNSKEAAAANREHALAILDLQGKVGELGTTFDGKLTPELIKTLIAGGMTEAGVKDLGKQFRGARDDANNFARKWEAEASAPGAKDAKRELEDAWAAALGFEGVYKAKSSAPGAPKAAQEILDAWNKANGFDGNYKASLASPGAPSSEAAIADAWAQAKGFDGKYNAKLMVTGDQAVNARLSDLMIKQRALATGLSYPAARGAVQRDLDRNRQRKATGGPILGPGTGTSDSIPAMVSNGEYVVKASSVKKIGVSKLNQINSTGELPAFALGGYVNWPFRTNVSKTKIPELDMMAFAGAVGGSFGHWPSSPSAQRGDSGVWHKILALVKASGIKYEFGNSYRPGDPKWHGSGRAIDFMGYNQDRLAQFFLARQGQVLELIHRTKNRDYGITRGHYAPMPHQWPLHRNHLHVAMANGGVINEPIVGVGGSGRTYSFGEYGPETVTPGRSAYAPDRTAAVTNINITLDNHGAIGSQAELNNWLVGSLQNLKRSGRF